jgi:ABC-type branched-subunit amino acid transport system permease subunit
VFFVYHQKHIEPGPLSPFGPFYTIQFLLMILIGGRHSVLGPAIGAVVVVFGPEMTSYLFEQAGLDVITTGRAQIFFGTMLALSVLTAPAGIVGQAQRGHQVFFNSIRKDRERGHGWARCVLMAFGRAVVPVGANE